jgi:hypothetical protein
MNRYRIETLGNGRWVVLLLNPIWSKSDPARCSRWIRIAEVTSEAEGVAMVDDAGGTVETRQRAPGAAWDAYCTSIGRLDVGKKT